MKNTSIDVTASGTTIPNLRLKLGFENDKSEKIKILGYSIKLFICNLFIGDVFKFEDSILEHKRTYTIDEIFNISPYIFNSIEKERNFGDVPVNATVQFLTIERLDSIQEFKVGNITIEHASNPQFKLSQQDWADRVSVMGYENYQIFEIPYSKVPDRSNFLKIMERLREAQDHFIQCRNEEVVTSCRKAFESLLPLVTIKNSKYEMNSKLANNIDLLCSENCHNKKSKLIEDLRQKIWPILHMGPHEGYDVTREDAEYILLLSLSTIRYFAKQLNKLSEK